MHEPQSRRDRAAGERRPRSRPAAPEPTPGAQAGLPRYLAQQDAPAASPVAPVVSMGPASGAENASMSAAGAAPAAAPAAASGELVAAEAPAEAAPALAPGEEAAAAGDDAGEQEGTGAGGGAAAAGGGAAPPVEPLMPPPPERLGPAAQARLASAQHAAGATATAESALPTADDNTLTARDAVTEPEEQMAAEASNALVAALDERPAPSPEIEELCQRIYKAIRDQRPPDEDSLIDSDPEAAAQEAGEQLNATIEGDTARVGGEYEQLAEGAEPAVAEEGTAPEQPPVAVETPPIGAQGAAPDPVPEEDVSLDADLEASAAQIDEAGMNTEPAALVEEGPIAEARDAQGELAESAARDPAEVIAEQQAAIGSAQADMAALQAQALAALNTARTGTIQGTGAQQVDMTGSEEQTRASVGAEAQAIFAFAQQQVHTLLEPLAETAMGQWEAGLPPLTREFRDTLADVKRSIADRHSGVGGFFVGAYDYVAGLPDWVVRRYNEAEQAFGDGVCDLIRTISRDVNAVVAAAEVIIETARQEIDDLFAALPEDLQVWAEEQRGLFAERLDGLQQEVHETRDGFTSELAQRAAGAVQDVREEIHALREAAGGLLGRIAAAVEAFLDDPIKFIIDGLLSLVGIPPSSFWRLVDRLGDVISGIADDPLGFANNLVEALKQGFQGFFDNIDTHLLQGLLDWLFSSLGSVGVELPGDLSLESIVTFFLQLMGLSWTNIRQILARHIGEDNVALIEQAYELISTLMEQGPAGILELIKEQLDPSVIMQTVMDAAIDYVVEALITRVTVRIIAMLNPAGAILSAIELIYRIIRWVFENAARIFSLIETVVNGAWDIMNGNTAGMASAIEVALAGLIPPVIDFLAGLIGLGDLPEAIADVIRGLQQWVLGIVDRVVGFIAQQARGLLAAVGVGGAQEDTDGPEWWHTREPFDDNAGHDHSVYFKGNERTAELYVASTPRTIVAFLAAVQPKTQQPGNEQYRSFYDAADYLVQQIDGLTTQLQSLPANDPQRQTISDQIEAKIALLAARPLKVLVALDAGGAGITSLPTDAQRAAIMEVRGGPEQLAKLDNFIASGAQPEKVIAEAAVIQVAFAAIAAGKNVQYIGLEVFRRGNQAAMSEIDVLTDTEMIEVKTGNYINEEKLSGRDMNQFTNLKRFYQTNKNVVIVDGAGTEVRPPARFVYQFTQPINTKLRKWLLDKGVSEVRAP